MEEKTSFRSDKLIAVLPNKKKLAFPNLITAQEIFEHDAFKDIDKNEIIAAEVNYKVTSLNQPLHIKEFSIKPILKSDEQGRHIYTASLVFLLGMAVETVVKEKHHFTVEYQFGSGVQCAIAGVKIDEDLSKEIHKCMLELIEKKLTIERQDLSFEHALRYFTERGREYTVSLIKSKNDEHIKVNTCGEYADLNFATVVPNTSYIPNTFNIIFQHEGIYLKYPKEIRAQEYLHTVKLPKLFDEQSKNVKSY